MTRAILSTSVFVGAMVLASCNHDDTQLRTIGAERYLSERECWEGRTIDVEMSSANCNQAESLRRGPDGDIWKMPRGKQCPYLNFDSYSGDRRNALLRKPPCSDTSTDAGRPDGRSETDG